MAIYIVQSRTGENFRRSGTEFPHSRWLAIDTADYPDSAAAILADPSLKCIEVTDTSDPDLTDDKDVVNPGIIPEPEE